MDPRFSRAHRKFIVYEFEIDFGGFLLFRPAETHWTHFSAINKSSRTFCAPGLKNPGSKKARASITHCIIIISVSE